MRTDLAEPESDTPITDACLKECNQNTFDVSINDLHKMYRCAKDLESRLRRAQRLIGGVVNDLPRNRDWLNPDYEREMREIGGMGQDINGNAVVTAPNLLDFAYPTIEDFERIVGYEVNDTFKDGWRMSRTTNAQLGITPKP